MLSFGPRTLHGCSPPSAVLRGLADRPTSRKTALHWAARAAHRRAWNGRLGRAGSQSEAGRPQAGRVLGLSPEGGAEEAQAGERAFRAKGRRERAQHWSVVRTRDAPARLAASPRATRG